MCGQEAGRRRRYRLAAFDVTACLSCGALQRDPLPDPAQMRAYYSDPAYIDHAYFTGGGTGAAVTGLGPEAALHREVLDALGSSGGPRRRLLDVGAGAGGFLALASARGWLADAVEISPELAERAAARASGRVVQAAFEEASLDEGAYELVTMWDLLEHTLDPAAVLARARRLLAPGGMLVVLTIDSSSLFNVLADVGWRLSLGTLRRPLELLYDKRHNHYFTAATLDVLLSRTGFRVDRRVSHRAHLGHWLAEPAGTALLAVSEVVDRVSMPLGRAYRQLLYCAAR